MFKMLLWSLFFTTSCFTHNVDSELDLETYLLINMLNAQDEFATRAPEQPIPKIACISLGFDCAAAKNFVSYKLSNAYYPLDFIKTPFEGL